MRRSTKDIDSQTYELLDDKTTATFAGVDALIKLNDISSAKMIIQNLVDGLLVLKHKQSDSPDKDVDQRKRIFMDYATGAMVCGRAASCLEEHDDLTAIKYFELALKYWNFAWFELDLLMNEWEILLPELIDEDFDFDYSYSYASRIAEAYDRLGQWNKVISSVEKSVELSGEKYLYQMKLLADAYENLGNYEKCIESYDDLSRHWYEEDKLEKQINIACHKVVVAQKFSKLRDAINFYSGFSDCYYRLGEKSGIIEFNIACLYFVIDELGQALITFHYARREFEKLIPNNRVDISKCDEAIKIVYSFIASGLDHSDIQIDAYDISKIMYSYE